MLPPLYLLWLLWPNCPLVPPSCRTIKPIDPKVGTRWLLRHDWKTLPRPITDLAIEAELCREPLHIRHLPRRRTMLGGMPSLAHAHLMAGMATPIGVDMAAAGQDRTVVVVRGRDDANDALKQHYRKMKAEPSVSAGKRTGWARWCAGPAQNAPKCKTPSTGQKPWRRPRGLSSAARRRQNKRRSNRRKGCK